MHILIAARGIGDKLGGAEESLLTLINHLAKSHRITLVNGTIETISNLSLPESVQYFPYHIKTNLINFPFAIRSQRLIQTIISTKNLYSYVRSIEKLIHPDIIISQKPPCPYTSKYTPTISFIRDLEFITYFNSKSKFMFSIYYLIQFFWGLIILKKIKKNNVIITNSNYLKSILNKKKISSTVIYPFINQNISIYQNNTFTSKKILFVSASLAKHKGVNILIELAKKMPNRQFLAIGRDTERFSSEFPPNIDWHPWFNDLSHVYQEAAILIVPSQLPETFGRVVVEAQNHGVPVIASYIGGLPESVGKGGVLVQPPDNIKRWIDSIELLFSDKIFYEKLRRNALKNAKYFNKVKMFKKFDSLLCDLLPKE